MPRFEVNKVERKIHPVQLIFYIIGFLLPGFSLWIFLNESSGFGATSLLIFSIILLIYNIGRIYGEFTISQDFVEITATTLSFRSTPPFGLGWLPISKSVELNQIEKVDIVQITPFYDPSKEFSALELMMKDTNTYIIGSNLVDEQIFKIGLALKGTVTFSRTLSRLLNQAEEGQYGEQIKDIIDTGKAIWKSIRGNKPESDD